MNLMNLFFSAILLTSLAGCSMRDDMKSAKDATNDMRDTTRRLEERTESVEGSSRDIYEDGREGGTANMMRESFNEMLKGGRESSVRKIEYASIYFSSFEFQFWRGRRGDTAEYRLMLMAKGADLFFAEIDDMIDESYPISILNPLTKGFANWLNLSVLAFTMDRVHDRQTLLSRERGFKPYSMLDIIQEGLSYKDAAERGETIPDFAYKVLQREQQDRKSVV